MSLLTRIAQTRQGAERLIEARVLPTLAGCDFLDTRADIDQTFIGVPLLKFCLLILIDTLTRSGSTQLGTSPQVLVTPSGKRISIKPPASNSRST
jgi:hypothetical protein